MIEKQISYLENRKAVWIKYTTELEKFVFTANEAKNASWYNFTGFVKKRHDKEAWEGEH